MEQLADDYAMLPGKVRSAQISFKVGLEDERAGGQIKGKGKQRMSTSRYESKSRRKAKTVTTIRPRGIFLQRRSSTISHK